MCGKHGLHAADISLPDSGMEGGVKSGETTQWHKQNEDCCETAGLILCLTSPSLPCVSGAAIYPNRSLRLDQISVYGFDYDYTIAHYTENLQPLIYNLAVHHLVKEVSPYCATEQRD
jgi:hypothetical protein